MEQGREPSFQLSATLALNDNSGDELTGVYTASKTQQHIVKQYSVLGSHDWNKRLVSMTEWRTYVDQ